jgi:hypothetical protein
LAKIAAGNRLSVTPDEAVAIVRESYPVFGTYTVNEADGMIAVHMKGSTLFPNEVGRDQIRKVCFSEDEMT